MLWLAALVTIAPLERIHQIGHDRLAADVASADIVAIGACTRPDAAGRDQVRAHVASWVAKSLPGQPLDTEPEIRFGCDELTGTLVDVHVDTTGDHPQGYWWTLRVAQDRVERVVEVTGMSRMDWMEWAAETSAATVALVDLDGDGRLDVVTARDDHEGGDIHHDIELSAVTTRSGKRTVITAGREDIAAVTRLPSLVVAITGAHHTVYRCIGADRKLGTCPDIATAQLVERARDAASDLAYAKELPDREQLAADLAALGIFDPALLADAPATTPQQHVQHDVARWLDEQRGERTDAELAAVSAAEQAAYELALDVALGDAPCGATTKAMLAAARAGHVSGVATPACGPYVWVTWTHDTTRVQQLVLVRGGVATPIIRGEDPASEDPTWEPEPMLSGAFHNGGAAIVRAGRVDVVTGEDVVANQTGVDYTVRGPVVTDGEHYFRAGRKGLEPVNDLARALIAQHEAHQAALDADLPTADQLRLLGAPAWLVDEARVAGGW
jgi:hypothetical protein